MRRPPQRRRSPKKESDIVTHINRSTFLAGATAAAAAAGLPRSASASAAADLIIFNARVTTLDPARPAAEAIAIRDGVVTVVGSDADAFAVRGPGTSIVDAARRRLIPGLNDSHQHLIRGGLSYNMELRWDGVPSVADALRMLRVQAQRTPPPQWVRVVGGWTEFQFAEKRLPTLAEINAAAPDTPVFILNLYRQAFLNGAALRAIGYDRNTPNPPGGEIQRDAQGRPTGLLVARPNASLLYATLAKGPKLSPDDQRNSTRMFMRELNRLGVTSVVDAGGGFQNYPQDYAIFAGLAQSGEVTVRTAYNLFTQHPGAELRDFQGWIASTTPYAGDAFYRHNGAGEMLVYAGADYEDFPEPRPQLPAVMESQLHDIVRLLAQHRWPFRLHATYGESISRFLDVFETVNREVPLSGARWWFDHAETISRRDVERVRALGGGIAVQDRMAFQGEYFIERYGARAAAAAPPIRAMLAADVPLGAGTDATRVSSYNPWVALAWLVSGRTVGGTELYGADNRVDRETALRLYTHGSAWFSNEERVKGTLAPGMYGDCALLSDDFLTVPETQIQGITSVLTLVGGRVVHAVGAYAALAPPPLVASPDWSPSNAFHPVRFTAHTPNHFDAHRHSDAEPLESLACFGC